MSNNLVLDRENKDFWVWVDPENELVKYHITKIGSFFSGGLIIQKPSNLPFLPNPEYLGDITPFSFGVMSNYLTEYNLERNRIECFPNYPSRLNALFLFFSEEDAIKYRERHEDHVGNRILKKCHSKDSYQYSIHDSSWIDFLRKATMINEDSLLNCCKSYWTGIPVENCELIARGKPWAENVISEVLYLGVVEFYDRDL